MSNQIKSEQIKTEGKRTKENQREMKKNWK
jgi:hypothetical protein